MGKRLNNVLKLLLQISKYTISTLPGTGVDTLVLWWMSNSILDGNHFEKYILSPTISFECAVIVNYLMAFFFVWRDRVDRHNFREFFAHFWKYNISCISAFLVKMLFLNIIGMLSHWQPFVCNLVALFFSGMVNFCLNEFLIFSGKRNRKAEAPQEEDPEDLPKNL